MGNTESTPSDVPVLKPLPKMVDLETTLQRWGWEMYSTTTVDPKDYEEVDVKVKWDNVHFETGKLSYFNKDGPSVVDTSMVFQSDFENNTKEQQEHNISTQRTTDAVATTTLFKGFTRGVKTGIEIPVPPDVGNVTSGFGNEIVINTEDRNSVKHSLTWTANSNIRVPPLKRTVAKLEIQQEVFQCDFRGSVTFRGNVKVLLTNNRTGTFVRIIENDIAQIVEDFLDKGNITYNDDPNGVVIEGKCVKWPISGQLNFKYGVSQKVVVNPA